MGNKPVRILSTGEIRRDTLRYAYEQGIKITVDPFIRILPSAGQATMAYIRELSGKKLKVIFTSKHAVRTVISCLEQVPEWEICCISGATKEEICSFWKAEVLLATADNGTDLATQIVSGGKNEKYIFFCGDRRMNDIPEQLRLHHLDLEEVIVYQTVGLPHRIDNVYDAIFFYSPSAVESYFSVNPVMDLVCFSIGSTTTRTLKKYIKEHNRIITALHPDKKSMVEMAISYFDKQTE
ncbi:MAG: uroporphyrinogen-III synthase [Tannerellaceae bacterium]|nr:uroporphyrinogen-III synthase [Tannerellaceae bacterium]